MINPIRRIISALVLLTTYTSLPATKPVTNLWNYYFLPCKHIQTGILQCLVTKKDTGLKLIKNNFAGSARLPSTGQQQAPINFDAIRESAHKAVQKLGFAKTNYIYTVGNGDPNTRTVIHAFLVDPTREVTLNNPPEATLVWEDLVTLAPVLAAAEIDSEFMNSVKEGSTNRYQRKIVYVDWDETKREIGFVKQNNAVTPQVIYEPTIYKLAEKNSTPYLLTSTAIKTTGSDTAERPEDDTAFERYDLVFTPTQKSQDELLFASKDPAQIKALASHWGNQQAMELAQRVPVMAGERALTLLTQGLHGLVKKEGK